MHFLHSFLLLTFSISVFAAPKLLICSDSTASNYASGALQGWAFYIHEYLSIPVSNLARAGYSTRLFINAGNWKQLLAQTSPGDFVVIEMGHNDESDPSKNDKYSDRGTLPGLGEESKMVRTNDGKQEKVYTFGHYLRGMIADVKAKQAIPILSGMVPRNYWKGTPPTLQSKWPFADYEEEVAKKTGVEWVDHTEYSVKAFAKMGEAGSKKYYPNDNTHTNAGGARINAETFVQAVRCGKSSLAKYLSDKGRGVKDAC